MLTTAITYTLLAVFPSAPGVTYTPGFPTLQMCMEAKSLAMTGETESAIAARLARERERMAWEADWFNAHPPREPATDEEREAVRQEHPKDGAVIRYYPKLPPGRPIYVAHGAKIQDVPSPQDIPPSLASHFDPPHENTLSYSERDRRARWAECVIVPGDR